MDVSVYGKVLSTLPEDDDHPYRSGPWRPQTVEYDAHRLDLIAGVLPADLAGVYLRNTENPVHPAIKRYHPFDGDGMIHMLSIRDGTASYRNRFVRTEGFTAEQAAGRSLWAGIAENPALAERQVGWGARGPIKDASSTDVVVHAGVALSSSYLCGEMHRLDPLTLDDLGTSSWGGRFPSNVGVAAHARVDEATGDLLFFNYATSAPYLHYGVVDNDDRLVHYVPIELPGSRLPHDIAFTTNYTILNDLPLFWDPELIAKQRYAARFHPDLPARLGVIPRRGSSDQIRWFEFDSTYVLHWTNAYEDGDEIVVEGYFQGNPEPKEAHPDGPADASLRFLALDALGTRLHRWRMNLVTGATSEQDLTDTCTDFGTVNGAFAGRPHRYSYSTTNRPGWYLLDGVVRHDSRTGAEARYRFDDGVYCSEFGVAPKVGARDEDDAYLITLTTDMVNDRSEAVVFDAADIEAGPVARLLLPARIASGTHSCWAPAARLPGW